MFTIQIPTVVCNLDGSLNRMSGMQIITVFKCHYCSMNHNFSIGNLAKKKSWQNVCSPFCSVCLLLYLNLLFNPLTATAGSSAVVTIANFPPAKNRINR